MIDEQYYAYLNGEKFKEYSTYMSQIGGQGMIFGLLDRIMPFSQKNKLKSLHMITALLSAKKPYTELVAKFS